MNKLEEYCQWLVTYDSAILNLLKQESRSARWQQALLSSEAPLLNSVIPKRIQYLFPGGAWLILLRSVLPSSLQEEGRATVGKTAVPSVSTQLFVTTAEAKQNPKASLLEQVTPRSCASNTFSCFSLSKHWWAASILLTDYSQGAANSSFPISPWPSEKGPLGQNWGTQAPRLPTRTLYSFQDLLVCHPNNSLLYLADSS